MSASSIVSSGGWTVVDIHWLSHTVEFRPSDGGRKVKVDFGFSTVQWVTTLEEGCHGEGGQIVSCVNVEYVVDRVAKVFLLDEVRAIGGSNEASDLYLDEVTKEVCRVEGLEGDACGHLKTFVGGGVRQRRDAEFKGGVWGSVEMVYSLCGVVRETWGWPFVQEFGVGEDDIFEFCEGEKEEGWDVEVEVRLVGEGRRGGFVPGWEAVAGNGDTTSVSSFVYLPGCQVNTCAGIEILKPREGERVGRRFEVEVIGEGVEWDVDGQRRGSEGNFWVKVEKEGDEWMDGGGLRRGRVTVRREGCKCKWSEFEIVEDYKVEWEREDGQGWDFNFRGLEFAGVEREEDIRVKASELGGVVEVEFGLENVLGLGGEVEGSGRRWARLEVLTPPPPLLGDLAIVTACSQEYVDDGRLGNLIGSILKWERGTKVLFYDLGVDGWVRERLESLGVEVVALPKSYSIQGVVVDTSPHFVDASTYAFKPLCIWDALKGRGLQNVLWIDAGAEVRRRLDGVRVRMGNEGAFLIKHEGGFPDDRYHHPDAVKKVGCEMDGVNGKGELPHCATTFVGVVEGSYMEKVIEDILVCAGDNLGCLNPEGSNRGNHRQEQTAMNAVFCRDGRSEMCRDDKEGRWGGSTEFINGWREGGGKAEMDRDEWNEVELYTRRVHPVKPYQVF